MKAMIFAAGLGTRLHPLTDNKPKALIKLNGVSLLEIIIKKLISAGFIEIIINVHHFAEQIIDFLKIKNNFGIKISISDESDILLDTGGALKKASRFFNDGKDFLVHNVDVLSDIDLNNFYNTHIKSEALTSVAVKSRHTSRYFLFNNRNMLCGWKNNKTNEIKIVRKGENKLNPLAFSGIHVINPKIFDLITEQGKFSIVDVYLRLASTHNIIGYIHNNSFWMDLGKKENLLEAEKIKI
ncbi:MAG: nucleotidyltransferase family protein [Bacteroidales bacterium]|nr:nucleotidyltransferase family protein [Bacteroidales bacterium]